MHRGFLKLHRKIVDWEWYSDIKVKSLYIDLLLHANIEDKKWQGKVIKKGQQITSIEHLSIRNGMSKQEVRTALDKLVKSGNINKQTTNKYTLITIDKYDIFNPLQQAEQQTTNNQITNEQQTNNKQSTTTKELKEFKNDKNNNNKHATGSQISYLKSLGATSKELENIDFYKASELIEKLSKLSPDEKADRNFLNRMENAKIKPYDPNEDIFARKV
jgi:DNA-binding transcriptional regulator PaaX